MHEIGHGLYGLMDSYCGDTYYTENDPDPNIWNSEQKCQAAARANNWNVSLCRQIQDAGTSCHKEFWRWIPILTSCMRHIMAGLAMHRQNE